MNRRMEMNRRTIPAMPGSFYIWRIFVKKSNLIYIDLCIKPSCINILENMCFILVYIYTFVFVLSFDLSF